LTWQSERTGLENKWFALTGRVVAVQVEADGELHIALGDATDPKPGIVVCEIPAGPTSCEIPQNQFQLDANAIPPAHSLDERTYDQRNADHHSNWQGILGCRARAQRSIKPHKEAASICSLGHSSRDDVARRSVNR